MQLACQDCDIHACEERCHTSSQSEWNVVQKLRQCWGFFSSRNTSIFPRLRALLLLRVLSQNPLLMPVSHWLKPPVQPAASLRWLHTSCAGLANGLSRRPSSDTLTT